MKNKLNQIIVTLIIVLSSLAAFGEILETEKITISNDFVVVSNATVGSMTIEQQIVWVQTDEILTNLVLTAGDPSPTPVNVLGTYIQIADSATLSAFSNGIYYVFGNNDNDYGINTILGDLGTAYWDKSGNNLPEGTYDGVTSGTGKVVAAYSIVTNTYTWAAGYNSTNLCWEIARDSVPIVSVYSDSNVFHQPIYGDISISFTNDLIAATNAINIVANAALPKAGGTMSGDLDMGGQAVTNVDYLKTTNYVWLPVNGTVYFGTTTNYIVDQAGTNFGFKIGTNDLINFGI